MLGHTGKHSGQSGSRVSRRKMWSRAFIVNSEGRNGQGKVKCFRIGLLNIFRRH